MSLKNNLRIILASKSKSLKTLKGSKNQAFLVKRVCSVNDYDDYDDLDEKKSGPTFKPSSSICSPLPLSKQNNEIQHLTPQDCDH